jgi:uroporphyrinogen-III synthase
MARKENAVNLEVYATLSHLHEVDEQTRIVVFTSPSNVEAFFRQNKFSSSQRAVAMGEATGKALERAGVKRYVMPRTFDDLGLFQAVLAVAV